MYLVNAVKSCDMFSSIFWSNMGRVSRNQGYYNFHIKKSIKCPLHIKKICLPSRIKVKYLNAKTFLNVVAAFSNSILKSPFEL